MLPVMIVLRLLYTAAVMVVVLWLLRTGNPLGGLLIVPAAAVWLQHEAESGRLATRLRRAGRRERDDTSGSCSPPEQRARSARTRRHGPRSRVAATRQRTASSAELLRQLDDQAFGSADVAEEERVLEVDDLPDRLPAGLANAVDDATHVVDLEGDVPEPRTVDGRRRRSRAGGRRVEAHHLEDVAAVGATSHHDLDRHVLETDDPIDPLAAERPGLAAVEAERCEEPDRLVEVLDDEADVDEAGDAGPMAVHGGQADQSRERDLSSSAGGSSARCDTTLTTVPLGSRSMKRRTPHSSSRRG